MKKHLLHKVDEVGVFTTIELVITAYLLISI